jgi:HD-like signal output (HDOD) protein
VTAAAIGIAGVLAVLGAWLFFRSRHGGTADSASAAPQSKSQKSISVAVEEIPQAERANSGATERLWRLAFGAPAEAEILQAAHAKVGDAVCAVLQAENLDPKYLPRRPTLMPQLLRAVDDPSAATEKLSRMIAHDPVLTADVLRLANSAVYRTSPAPIETIQRAIVVLGVDSLRGLVATAMLQPVFRATRSNFPRFPRLLWERTERAARAAEMYALKTLPQDRFEAQLAALMSALGPLVVYGATLDAYAGRPNLAPNASLCASLITALGPQVAVRVARHWDTSPRLVAAIEGAPQETLSTALCVGELLGTLSLLEAQHVMAADEGLALAQKAGFPSSTITPIWERLTSH